MKVPKNGYALADVRHRQYIDVGEDERWHAARAQPCLQFDHRRDGREDVGERAAEVLFAAPVTGQRLGAAEELRCADVAGLEFTQQVRVRIDRGEYLRRRGAALCGDGVGSAVVVEIKENLAEIKDNAIHYFSVAR